MLRFALLRHDCPADYRDGPHWDLMAERPDTEEEHRLATWSLLRLPAAWGGNTTEPIAATPLPDHRARYLDYEGPVSQGRGEVRRVAGGKVNWLTSSSNEISLLLHGPDPYHGVVRMQLANQSEWFFVWKPTP